MMRNGSVTVFIGLLVVLGAFLSSESHAQTFPYLVPPAPEFDSAGNRVQSKPSRKSSSKKRSSHRRAPRSNSSSAGYRATGSQPPPNAQPTAPMRWTAPPGPQYGAPPGGPSLAATDRRPGPSQVQPQPDCSRYPMMLAHARSEAEMRSIARHFLTCLLQSGWSMEAAKKHVISTIETARVMR